MPTLTLRTLSASAFTTKGLALDDSEFDNNFIQLKAEIDAMTATLAAITAHTQNEDTYLDFGGSNQVSAADLKILLDDIPVATGGSEHDELKINTAATAYEIVTNAWGFFYMVDNASNTTITVADTLSDIGGTLSEGEANNLSASGTGITNNSGATKLFMVDMTLTLDPASHAGDHEWEIGVAVDGSNETSKTSAYADGTNNITLSWCGIVEIGDGLVMQPRIANVSDTDDAIVKHLQIQMKSIN